MNFSYFFLLAAALLGVFAKAYEMGYGGGFLEGGYGGAGCGAASVSDTCQCVKTVVRPVVEQIPYVSSRRIHTPGYMGGLYRGSGLLGGFRGGRFFNGGFSGCGRLGAGIL